MRWFQRRSKKPTDWDLTVQSQSLVPQGEAYENHCIMAQTESVMTLGNPTPTLIVHGYACTCNLMFDSLEDAKAHMEYFTAPIPPEDLANVVKSLKSIEKDLA